MDHIPDGMRQGPLSELIATVKQNWENEFVKQPDHPERARIEASFADLDPTPYFGFCKRLKIGYENLFPSGEPLPYSVGLKMLFCAVVNREESGDNLKELFTQYRKRNCDLCTQRSPRPTSWLLTFDYLEDINGFFGDEF